MPGQGASAGHPRLRRTPGPRIPVLDRQDPHRAQGRPAAIVRAVLAEAGIDAPDVDRYSATVAGEDGKPRYVWSPVRPGEEELHTYRELLIFSLAERQHWRLEYEDAKRRIGPPGSELSATDDRPAELAA